MAPPRKKAKTSPSDEKAAASGPESELADDYRTSWLLASAHSFVKITAKGETFRVHKNVICRHSAYFWTCLGKPFKEADDQAVAFDDIEPKFLAFYLGVAYTYSSILPHARPGTAPAGPAEMTAAAATALPGATLRDFIEVYKLSDRFLSPRIGRFMLQCINASIWEGHRTLFCHMMGLDKPTPSAPWTHADPVADKTKTAAQGPGGNENATGNSGNGKDADTDGKGADRDGKEQGRETQRARQRRLLREFADGYEALETGHAMQGRLAGRIVEYFCGGVDYGLWVEELEAVMGDRPRFVGMVSRGFAEQLAEVARGRRGKVKRRQLGMPVDDYF